MLKIQEEIKKYANPKQAELLSRFFKTKPGEYGEGDIFLGLKVPRIRKIAKQFSDISSQEVQLLLNSKIHEERLCALFILMIHYKKASPEIKEKIFKFYLNNTKNINNWDLIDLSAPSIIGDFLLNKPRDVLFKLAKSSSLWEKRISVLATFVFIKNNQFEDSLKISEILLQDKHDLIHKAVGWMLREIGKRSLPTLEKFLKHHYKIMPRTMLRYSIEKFPENRRKQYLNGKV